MEFFHRARANGKQCNGDVDIKGSPTEGYYYYCFKCKCRVLAVEVEHKSLYGAKCTKGQSKHER